MNYIENREGRPFCTSCKETVSDIVKHLKQHGIVMGGGGTTKKKNKWTGTNKVMSAPLGQLLPELGVPQSSYVPTPEEIERDRKWGVNGGL